MAKSKKQEASATPAAAPEAAPKGEAAGPAPAAGVAKPKRAPKQTAGESVVQRTAAAPAAQPTVAAAAPAAAPPVAAGKAGAKKATAAKPAAPAKAAPPAATVPARPSLPTIDTNLAAQAAASMVAHRDLLGDVGPAQTTLPAGTGASPAAAAPKQESANFKQLKQGLNKPASGGLGNLFGPAANQKKSNTSFGGGGPNFRNQTTGNFSTRTGVPRRTGGG